MICPNCGEINAVKIARCEGCSYDFAEINQNVRCCRLALSAVIACFISFFGFILLVFVGLILSLDFINFKMPSILGNITLFTIAACVVIAPIIAIISRIRITLAQGRFYGYKHGRVVIILTTIVLIFVTGTFLVQSRNHKYYNTHDRISRFAQILASYAKSHDGMIPSDDNWVKEIDAETVKNFHRDNLVDKPLVNFAINSYVAGMKLSELPDDAVVVFETQKTLEHNAVFFAGIQAPKTLTINNDEDYYGCTVLLKSSPLRQLTFLEASPLKLTKLNWMNTDKLVLPNAVNEYLLKQEAAKSAAHTIATVFMLSSLPILIYLIVSSFGLRTISLTLISCAIGGWLGSLAQSFHYHYETGWQAVYMSSAVSAFIAATYCLIIHRMKTKLQTGHLRRFFSATATAAGAVCSIIVHLLFMLLNFKLSPVTLIAALGWGIVAGAVMGIIANRLIFRNLLKWQPVAAQASEQQSLNNGEII